MKTDEDSGFVKRDGTRSPRLFSRAHTLEIRSEKSFNLIQSYREKSENEIYELGC